MLVISTYKIIKNGWCSLIKRKNYSANIVLGSQTVTKAVFKRMFIEDYCSLNHSQILRNLLE